MADERNAINDKPGASEGQMTTGDDVSGAASRAKLKPEHASASNRAAATDAAYHVEPDRGRGRVPSEAGTRAAGQIPPPSATAGTTPSQELAGIVSEDMRVLDGSLRATSEGMRQLLRVWVEYLQRGAQIGAMIGPEVLRCRSPQELVETQRRLLTVSSDAVWQGNLQLLKAAGDLMREASRPIEARMQRRQQGNQGSGAAL